MSKKDLVLKIDKPNFVVKLHTDLFEVDMKEGAKKELEDVIERNAALRESLGVLFQTMVTLDVPLKDIDSVHIDDSGNLKIVVPWRKDITIPLTEKESQKLMEKMNELIRVEKEKELRRIAAQRKQVRETTRETEESTFEARRKYG